jgi:hypothetical protein
MEVSSTPPMFARSLIVVVEDEWRSWWLPQVPGEVSGCRAVHID